MFTPQPITTNKRTRTQRGQSIVIALLVLLLLGLAGALFVTIVARNIVNAAHGARVQTADSYARAGLTYADAQLMSSADGADWRPPLQYQLAAAYLPTDARELARYNAQIQPNNPNGLGAVSATDPDAEYLSAGYARYNTGAGRFLVRVTYDPVNVAQATVPPGKYLKIESIGREGVIDPNDPTTYTNNRSSDRTQAYQVAYLPIGITDYARFETNLDKRSDIANLGVASQFYAQNTDGGIATPGVSDFNSTGSVSANGTTAPTIQEYPVLTTYGAPDAYIGNPPTQVNPKAGTATTIAFGFTPGGGSIHANMPVRFFGTNIIYLNNISAILPVFEDTAEIGGDLLLDSYDPKASLNNKTLDTNNNVSVGQQAALILNPVDLTKLTATPIPGNLTATPPTVSENTYITPSNDNQSLGDVNPPFSTQNGLIRDGSMQNDAAGLPRSITRLDPPLLDTQDPASQMPRYRAIAMNSAPRTYTNAGGTTATYPATASQYGYGKAIYVNNPTDVQTDSASIGGGSTLTDEWLHRTTASATAANKGGWNGLFYNPPGVTIVLGQELAPPANSSSAGTYGIRLTRTAGDSFVGPDGTTPAGAQMDVTYADLGCEATNTNLNAGTSPDNDIVIYAEGNVRVRGILSPNEGTGATAATQKFVPRHITIVTNGTAYIEGNLLKGDPDSSISVLAHDYVCINTTQFLAGPMVDEHTDGTQSPDLPKSSDPLDTPIFLDEGHSLVQEFNFGLTGAATPAAAYPNTKLALYVAAGPEAAGTAKADFDILNLATNTALVPAPPALTLNTFTRTTYDLSSFTSVSGAAATDLFHLSVSKDNGQEDPSGVSSTAGQNVALERVAVLPMDIRIEAVLYAQTRSFFVIPGEWFNTNAADNLDSFHKSFGPYPYPGILIDPVNGTRPDLSGLVPGSAAYTSVSRFPMYGQPIDLKITLSGSVSEAHPADIAAQTAWMQKWGWIPQYHGSLVVSGSGGGGAAQTTETAGHPGNGQPAVGLQIVYDPQAGYPYDPMPTGNGATPYYLRSDKYGRPLPFTPMLPVSTGLLYSGQSGEAPLLQ